MDHALRYLDGDLSPDGTRFGVLTLHNAVGTQNAEGGPWLTALALWTQVPVLEPGDERRERYGDLTVVGKCVFWMG